MAALGVGVCVFGGVLLGHPAAGLIAGGGAMTVGFGVNQRIAESRIWPMIAATLVMAFSTFIGMTAGHHGTTLLIVSTLWALNYGLLTALAPGISWVGQQAAVFLFIASAFPATPHAALLRSSLILLGGAIQIVICSTLLREFRELTTDLIALPTIAHESIAYLYHAAPHPDPAPVPLPTGPDLRHQLKLFFHRIPHLPGIPTFPYAIRLAVTVLVAAETYRRLGIQSGYWIPMTALLVQKPAFAETFVRALMRIAGTLAGAGLSTFVIAHIHPHPLILATGVVIFVLTSYCTVNVNYALFSLCLTTYIVFILSLNAIPAPEIAHRRALCTIAGGLIALVIHLDGLRNLSRSKHLPQALPS